MSRKMIILTIAAMAAISVDQLSKWLAAQAGLVTLNQGVSFGLFSLLPPIALTLTILVLLGAVWYLYRFAWQRQPIASALLFGGAVSNVIDRVLYGGVQDWIPVPLLNLHNNIADYAIAVGLVWLLFFGLRQQYRQSMTTVATKQTNPETT